MKKPTFIMVSLLVLVSVLLSACSAAPAISEKAADALQEQVDRLVQERLGEILPQAQAAESNNQPANEDAPVNPVAPADTGLLAAYEQTLTKIYEFVNPSVVNIRVVTSASNVLGGEGLPEIPGLPDIPGLPEDGSLPFSQGLGSGFVWDEQGHIVTNNHVVENAEKIEVTFHDGTVAEAALVGADPDSDLAVIKVDLPQDQLLPVVMADSDQVKVGELPGQEDDGRGEAETAEIDGQRGGERGGHGTIVEEGRRGQGTGEGDLREAAPSHAPVRGSGTVPGSVGQRHGDIRGDHLGVAVWPSVAKRCSGRAGSNSICATWSGATP